MQRKANCDLIEVFRTESGVVYQCNKKNTICLEYSGSLSSLKVRDFLDFVKRVNLINLDEMASSSARHSDVAILSPQYIDRCFVLSLRDAVELRELLNGAKFMLQLNSIVRECLSSPVQ